MRFRLLFGATALLGVVTSSNAQLAQAMSAVITQDDAINVASWATLTPTSVTHQPRTLDFRAVCWAGDDVGFLPDGLMGSHDYDGYVRVKWLGASRPTPGITYGATYDVWSVRQGSAVPALSVPPGNDRSVTVGGSLLNTYLPLLPLDATLAIISGNLVGGYDVGDSDHWDPINEVFTELFTLALPTGQSDANWNYMGTYSSGALFSVEADGFYYANVQMVGITSFSMFSDKSGGPQWGSGDGWNIAFKTRIVYKLVSVAGQGVTE